MTEKLVKYRRTLWGLFAAGLAFAFVTLMGQLSLSSQELTDGEKRQKIEILYAEYKKEFPDVKDISAQQALDLLNGKTKFVFIDVREPREQGISMLPGAITEDEYLKNPGNYDDYIKIGYCTISYRSGKFAQKLQKKGIDVYNLRGGLLAWVHAGGKVYDRNGETHRIHVYGRKWNLAPGSYQAIW